MFLHVFMKTPHSASNAQKDFELLKCLSFTKQPSMANVAEAAAFNFFETSSATFLSATLLVERSKHP